MGQQAHLVGLEAQADMEQDPVAMEVVRAVMVVAREVVDLEVFTHFMLYFPHNFLHLNILIFICFVRAWLWSWCIKTT